MCIYRDSLWTSSPLIYCLSTECQLHGSEEAILNSVGPNHGGSLTIKSFELDLDKLEAAETNHDLAICISGATLLYIEAYRLVLVCSL